MGKVLRYLFHLICLFQSATTPSPLLCVCACTYMQAGCEYECGHVCIYRHVGVGVFVYGVPSLFGQHFPQELSCPNMPPPLTPSNSYPGFCYPYTTIHSFNLSAHSGLALRVPLWKSKLQEIRE